MDNITITDFTDPRFADMFRRYFGELNIAVRDWDGLFREMNGGENMAVMSIAPDGHAAGFIQFCPMSFESWFFSFRAGFIREFWVEPESRGRGIGAELLRLAEESFKRAGLRRAILTTDTAEGFYRRFGYVPAPDIGAKNSDTVFIRDLEKIS